jgi:hypothetical protein
MGAAPIRIAGESPAGLAPHKGRLLALLRAAYQCGPGSRPLDLDFAWRLIEAFEVRHRLEETWASQIESPDQRRFAAGELADVCHKTRLAVEKATAQRPNRFRSELGAAVIRAMAHPAPDVGCADPYREWQRGWEEIQHLIGRLAIIEGVAREVAEQNLRPHGAPTGGGGLPATQVEHLAMIFSQITVSKPTSTETGPFMGFVRAVRDALDIPLGDDGVRRVVLIGLRQSKVAARKPAK